MTELIELYQLAEKQGHDIYWYSAPNIEAISVMDSMDGSCAIALNPYKIESTADEKYKLAHELGHCECGAFYNRYSPVDLIGKHEHRADKWAIKKLLPKQELIQAFKNGNYLWEVAEMFEAPEELVKKAMEYYHNEELYNC